MNHAIKCLAVDLIGEHEQKLDNTHVIITSGRSMEYHGAYLTRRHRSICIYRIEPREDVRLGVMIKRRYVDFDHPVWLVPIRSAELTAGTEYDLGAG